MAIKRVKEHLVYQNKWIELYDDEVLTAQGGPGTYARLRYRGNPPGVVIVPRLPDGRVLLLRSFRYAMGDVSVEFPRGMAEQVETVEDAAKRELWEETGLTAVSLELLGRMRPDTSIVETEVHLVVLEIESLDSLTLDHEVEGIEAYATMTLAELKTAVRQGKIVDGFTLSAFAYLEARNG